MGNFLSSDDARYDRTYNLHKATIEGDLEKVKELIRESDIRESYNSYSHRPRLLVTATKEGHTEIVKFLLEKGENPNAADPKGIKALELAYYYDRREIYRLLREKGASNDHHIGILSEDSSEDRDLARSRSHALKLLLDDAILEGNPDKVTRLITLGVDVNFGQSHCIKTPLMYAAEGGHTEIVKRLLESGANPNAVAMGRRTALMSAAEGGHTEIVELLSKNHTPTTSITSITGATAIGTNKQTKDQQHT